MALTIGVLTLLSSVPLFGLVAAVVNQILLLAFVNSAIDCVHALIDARAGGVAKPALARAALA